MPLVYNTKRSGAFDLGGRKFRLRRVAFPSAPPPEWFVVNLLEHADQAGVARADVVRALKAALETGRFDRGRPRAMAERYGTKATQALLDAATGATAA